MKLQIFFLLFFCSKFVFCGSISKNSVVRKRSTQNLEEICGKSSITPEFESLTSNEIIVTADQWPWMGALFQNTRYLCGGSIVSEKLIVTGAHCIKDKGETVSREAGQLIFIVDKSDFRNDTQQNFQSHQVSEIILHSNWDSDSDDFEADIALAILKTSITFSKNVLPICLPSTDFLQYNVKGAVTRWKIEENTWEPTVLKLTKLSAMDKSTCIKSDNEFGSFMGPSTFCTEFFNGPCFGGAGAAYAQLINDRWTLMGVVSYALVKQCEEKRHIGITDVTNFIDWIKEHMPDTSHDENFFQTERENKSISVATGNLEEICGISSITPGLQSLVSYGNTVTSEQWPWIGALNYGTIFICGGSIVSEKFIVTAAHCIIDKYETVEREANQLIFIVGKNNLKSHIERNFQLLPVSTIILHPNWDAALTTYEADIALLTLRVPITFNKNVMPICLPSLNSLQYDVKGAVAGWGATQKSSESTVLKLAKLSAVDRKTCIKADNFFAQVMSSTTFCTELSESGPCKGDSGGGYAQKINERWTLLGIVSFTISNTCKEKHHIGFTDVSKFANWIKEHMTENIEV